MVGIDLKRRAFLTGLATSSIIPNIALAEDFIDLEWEDLLPEGAEVPTQNWFLDELHDSFNNLMGLQPASSGVRGDWNGKVVRIPGFIVPIDYSGTGVSAFILVPYVGACVHVPPPPANQLVFVTTERPYETEGLFEPVNVTGMFGVSSIRTQIAEVGYALSADKIEPFRS
jgi:hypothetical protein